MAVLAFLAWNATRVFDFFDMSAFLDAGYRVLIGQKPYEDFFFQAGPVHLYAHAASFALLGFGRAAIVAHLLLTTALAMFCTFLLARRRLGFSGTLLAITTTGFAFAGPASHPWYDQTAYLFVFLALPLIDRLSESSSRRDMIATGFAAGVCAALAFLAKANVGAAGAGLLIVFLTFRAGILRAWPTFAFGFLIPFALLFGLRENFSEFIRQCFVSYAPGGRLLQGRRLHETVAGTPYLLLLAGEALLVAAGGLRFVRAWREELIVLTLLLVCAVFIAFTGSMLPAASLSPLGFAVVLLLSGARLLSAAGPSTCLPRVASAATTILAIALLVFSFFQTARLHAWSWRDLASDPRARNTSDYELRSAPLEGWRCNGWIGEGVDRTAEFIVREIPRDSSILVLPDATVLYALTGRESYRGAPIFFHLEHVPPPGPDLERFRETIRVRPPDWIVLHDQTEIPWIDTKKMLEWLGLDAVIANDYELRYSEANFRAFARR